MALIRDICGLNYDIMVEVGKAVEAKRKADTLDYWISRDARKLSREAQRAWLSSDASDGSPLDIALDKANDNALEKYTLNKRLPMDFMEFFDTRRYKNLSIKATIHYLKAEATLLERATERRQLANARKYTEVRRIALDRGWVPRMAAVPRSME